MAFLGVPNQRGVELAVADYGPIGGHDVTIGTGLDDLCSADGGQAAAQTIVADEQVVGVIGTSCSGAATAASPLVSEAGMVMISGSNTSPALTSDLAGTAGGRPGLLDTTVLGAGTHVVTATVERWSAPDTVVTATVTVVEASGQRTALLALGDNPDPTRQWPDAMVGSYYGAATGQPVLLTGPDAVPATTADLLDDVAVTVIGGPVAIADRVVRGLDVAERLEGDTRYGTAVAVTERLRRLGLRAGERLCEHEGALEVPGALPCEVGAH